jgi:cell division protein FtsW (lipid II flippase)
MDFLLRRFVSIFAAMQVLVVVFGFFWNRIQLKALNYPNDPLREWNPRALWLREYGWVLLIIPVVWTLWAALRRKDSTALPMPVMISGIVLLAVMLLLFGEASLCPGVRHFLTAR